MKIGARWLASLAILVCLLVLLAPVVYAIPPTPHSFYGTLKINGQSASIGTVITAKFGAGVMAGTYTTTEAGKYGDNVTKGYLAVTHENIHEGDNISFYVNGVAANQTVAFRPGEITELNLTMVFLLGDANGDGKVNALDITRVERIIAGLAPLTPGADANSDGNVNNTDIIKVERLIVGLD